MESSESFLELVQLAEGCLVSLQLLSLSWILINNVKHSSARESNYKHVLLTQGTSIGAALADQTAPVEWVVLSVFYPSNTLRALESEILTGHSIVSFRESSELHILNN